MSQAGNDMIAKLASLLENDLTKTAAKKDEDEKKEEKKEKCECTKDCKCDKGDCKCEKEDKKKASELMSVLNSLVKLAGELDDMGADDASLLVDDAIKSLVSQEVTPEPVEQTGLESLDLTAEQVIKLKKLLG